MKGAGSKARDFGGPSIHSHITAEHGMKRVRIGKRQKWMRVTGSPYQDWAKREEQSRLRYYGNDSIRRDIVKKQKEEGE